MLTTGKWAFTKRAETKGAKIGKHEDIAKSHRTLRKTKLRVTKSLGTRRKEEWIRGKMHFFGKRTESKTDQVLEINKGISGLVYAEWEG